MVCWRWVSSWRGVGANFAISLAISLAVMLPGSGASAQSPVVPGEQDTPQFSSPKDDDKSVPNARVSIHGQLTAVSQFGTGAGGAVGGHAYMPTSRSATGLSGTIFLGFRLADNTEIYADVETNSLRALNDSFGAGAFPNGDANRRSPQPTLHIARLYVVQTIPLGGEMEAVADGPNQLAGMKAQDRVTIAIGKFALNDFFDNNAYAHDARAQFLNFCFVSNCAWDMAGDTLGFTEGIYAEIRLGDWALRGAYALEPTEVNGRDLDMRVGKGRSVVVEAERRWGEGGRPGAVRVLVYDNRSQARVFPDALAQKPSSGYHSLRGVGASVEQSITPKLGVFARVGYSDGKVENMSFTQSNRSVTIGATYKGLFDDRPDDVFGVAFGQSGLSRANRDYLVNGGVGLQVGSGQPTRYADERFMEAWYAFKFARVPGYTLTLDAQALMHPGYDRRKRTSFIFGVRNHLEF